MIPRMFEMTLLLIGLGGMTGTTAWVLRKGNNNCQTRLFMACQISMILWLVSQLLILFSESSRQLTISYLIGNLGISVFAPTWLMFSAEFFKQGAGTKGIMNLMPAVSAAAFLVCLTNPWHKLYYTHFGNGGITYGRLFYVFQAVYYICLIAAITLMSLKIARGSRRINKQAILLILSTAVPLGINTLTLTGILNVGIELTPLFFSFSSIMVLIAFSRYGLLNINSIAIADAVGHIASGVMVFANDGEMTYCNNSARQLLGGEKSTYQQLLERIRSMGAVFPENDTSSAIVKSEGRHYDINQNFVRNSHGVPMARVVIISDLTEYYELAEAERRLSLEQERNRIAQEIHDSAGHTFTMISSLARLLSVNTPEDSPMHGYITEIDGLSRSGVTQLRCSINNLRDDTFMTSVEQAVRTVAGAVRGMDIDICVQGSEDKRFAFCIRQVYDNTRETITNTMRYSGASRIDIILKFLSDRLELYIFDNGKGCSQIGENNGLRGIRERTESLGGTVRFSSVEGEGFSTIIKIPLKKEDTYDKSVNS